jgi:protein O-mannosyl-transferase
MNEESKYNASQQEVAATRSNPGTPSSGWRELIFGLGLVLAVIVAYQPAWHGGFIWDDDTHISDNETLRSWHGLWEIWFKPGATCQYYPLSFTVFWLGYQLWGLNTLGYHLLNVALHSLVAVLLWQILERLKVRGAWLAGAIFALHPVCVMSVAWMTEVKNTLSAALALGAGWAYLRFAGLGVYGPAGSSNDHPERSASWNDWRYGVLSLALFQMAMFAKTAVSFLPATLLLVVWWQRERLAWRKAVPLLLMLVLVVVMGQVTFYIEHLHGAVGAQYKLGWLERVLVSGRSFWFYLGKLIFPYSLTFIYERWDINPGAGWQYLYPAATVGLFGALWRMRRVIGKGPFAAMLHFYISTSLLILIVVLYMTRYSYVSDHWQYFGCMSVLALGAAGITSVLEWLGQWNRFLKPVVAGTLLLVLGLLTWRQAGMYTDMETLWQTTLARNPDCSMAHNNLGNDLLQKGNMDEAIAHFQKALQVNPDDEEVCYNLGNALLKKGSVDEAIAHFQKALQINPDYAAAHNNLGNTLLKKGSVDEAIAHFQKALQIRPGNAEAHNNLGLALFQKGQADEAMVQYQMALEIQPDSAEAHNNLGLALFQKGRVDEAMVQYQMALEIQPDNPEAHNNLGLALFQKGRVDEAIIHFQKALQINPNDEKARIILGNALVKEGGMGEAMVHYQKALQINPHSAEAQNNLAWLLATAPQASLRNGNQAVELAQQANQQAGGRNPIILRTLAAAYAEAGRFPEAVATAQHALQLAGAQTNTTQAGAIRSQLELYQAGTSFHLH